MEWIFAGMTFGFLGSFHCVGMCGPIALALPRDSEWHGRYIATRIVYNLGRVVTYTVLGAGVGLLSGMISVSGYQQGLSILMGILLLLVLGWNRLRHLFSRMQSLPQSLVGKLTGKIRTLFGRGGFGPLFLIGILNGFLPCGFVYMALATAATTGVFESSVLFMAGFGFGTIPAMLGISLAGGFLSVAYRQKLQKLSPYFIGAVGILLILRGLELGIPFISPIL